MLIVVMKWLNLWIELENQISQIHERIISDQFCKRDKLIDWKVTQKNDSLHLFN